jgi:rubrerythrin
MARVAIDLRDAVEDPEPRAESPRTVAASAAASPAEFADWVDFTAAGVEASGEFRCADCGYGVVVQNVLPPCPMCQATVWERRVPFAARFAD